MAQRNKNILLVIGFVLFLVMAYRLAIYKTFYLKNEINTLKSEQIDPAQISELSGNLELRNQFADSVLKKYNIRNSSIQNSLLEFLNEESILNGISIVQFQEPHVFKVDDVKATSYPFTIEGQYIDIERVLYKLEQQQSFGKVSHVHFEKKRDYRHGKDYLECLIILRANAGK